MATQRPIKSLSELMDGGAWKNEAVKKIKDYLNRNLYGHNVVIIA